MRKLNPAKAAAIALVAAFLYVLTYIFHVDAATDAYAAPSSHTVVIEGMKFVPDSIAVKAGDTVVWVNKDLFPHTATAQDRTFDSGELAANVSWKYIVSKPGKYAYVCTLHPTMKGTIVVD